MDRVEKSSFLIADRAIRLFYLLCRLSQDMHLPFTTAESEPQEVLHTAKELHATKEKTNRKLRTFLETKKSLPAGASEG